MSLTPIIIKRALCAGLLLCSVQALAGAREQAMQIHSRVAGVPPSQAVLLAMTDHINNNDVAAAVRMAMENDGFYRATLKAMATPWTNRDFSPFAPLNDYTATVMGLVRDERDFRTLLYGDVLYTGAGNLGLPPYSLNNNEHYQALEAADVELIDALTEQPQSTLTGLPSAATAGVMTSRAGAKAFYYAGTNRAMFRFTLLNHLCRDLEQVHDTTRTPDRIRQDVSRSPGGDSRVFLNNCVGCHSGMDPMAQAFAYYDYEYDMETDPDAEFGALNYNGEGETDPATGTRVEAKYHINAGTFAPGYITENDQWDNYWRAGPNAILEWDPTLAGEGAGAKSLGMELAHSGAFASCQVEKVFTKVCLRQPGNSADRALVETATSNFASSGYNLKQVFIDTADYCKGQ
ncbi:hypothetical protein QWI17_02400 [Gilvimarinus sp. SDUM040013]|uniref:DUF1585 domain-containing protein n=1 Tax=Gilvimarinus gilvus TaxID=3058038 RepID=A0ABU4S4R2_9GAMM|nr:hypothetical protein [Gilvimarinus sp. SDUM040013]MDO3384683.1 hypothetical protein [Gilvimarinus sp. SDUM040013]MDX6850269.1 hypothetical protein [Gilvimarinus sp. SDUM040013]